MWLTSSSIGRKLVMAITGICLVLFVTFHCLMNAVAIFWPTAYNVICQFLGANWYALVASAGLGLLFVIHIVYALWLTFQNRAARGNDRYAVNAHYPGVEWSSKNMLVLGIVVLAFLALHLVQFWAKMQLQELISHDVNSLDTVNGVPALPQYGTLFFQIAFSQWYTPVLYIIGLVALWFHFNHGFWSMFQTIGWNNTTWLPRVKCIAFWWTSVVVGLFIIQALVFTYQAKANFYTTDGALQEQYIEGLSEQVEPIIQDFVEQYNTAVQQTQAQGSPLPIENFFAQNGDAFLTKLQPIADAAAAMPASIENPVLAAAAQIVAVINQHKAEIAAEAAEVAPLEPVAEPADSTLTTEPVTTN